MAGKLATAYIDIIGRIKNFTDSLKTAKRQLTRFNADTVKKFEQTARNMKRVGQRMTLFVTAPLVLLARKMVMVSSVVEEQTAKFGAVFKETGPGVMKWADDYSKAVKRSKYDLIEWLAAVQDIFVPMGFARDEAADFSKKLVALTIDLASFQDKAEPDVLRDLTSGLMGMSRAMFKYGVNIRDGRVKQKVYQMGLAKTGEEMTELHKLHARYQLIVEDTKDAMGDAERTATSFANSWRALGAASKDLQKAFGDLTKEAIKPTVIWLTQFLKKIEEGPTAMKKFAGALALIAGSIGPALLGMGALAQMISTSFEIHLLTRLKKYAETLALIAMYHPTAAAAIPVVGAAAAIGGSVWSVKRNIAAKRAEAAARSPEEQARHAAFKERQLYALSGKRPGIGTAFGQRASGEFQKALDAHKTENTKLREKTELLNAEWAMRIKLHNLIPQEERTRTAWLEAEMGLLKEFYAEMSALGALDADITKHKEDMGKRLLTLYDEEIEAVKKLKEQQADAGDTLREMSKSYMMPIQKEVAALYDRAAKFRKVLGNDIRVKNWVENEKLKIAKRHIETEMGMVSDLSDAVRQVWEPQWMASEDKWKRAMVAGRSVTTTTTPAQSQADAGARANTILAGILTAVNATAKAEEQRLRLERDAATESLG